LTLATSDEITERWRLISTAYDDGGLSGGSMERPALRRLLVDVEQGIGFLRVNMTGGEETAEQGDVIRDYFFGAISASAKFIEHAILKKMDFPAPSQSLGPVSNGGASRFEEFQDVMGQRCISTDRNPFFRERSGGRYFPPFESLRLSTRSFGGRVG